MDDELEQLFDIFGHVTVANYGNGWYASVEKKGRPGFELRVKSMSGHRTAAAAVHDLLTRVHQNPATASSIRSLVK